MCSADTINYKNNPQKTKNDKKVCNARWCPLLRRVLCPLRCPCWMIFKNICDMGLQRLWHFFADQTHGAKNLISFHFIILSHFKSTMHLQRRDVTISRFITAIVVDHNLILAPLLWLMQKFQCIVLRNSRHGCFFNVLGPCESKNISSVEA